jgi:hypothetical protein
MPIIVFKGHCFNTEHITHITKFNTDSSAQLSVHFISGKELRVIDFGNLYNSAAASVSHCHIQINKAYKELSEELIKVTSGK